MAEALIGGERTRGSALSRRRTRPRRAWAHANEAWDVRGIRARGCGSRWRARAGGDRGRGPRAGRATVPTTRPRDGHTRAPGAEKREHWGLFPGGSHLRLPPDSPSASPRGAPALSGARRSFPLGAFEEGGIFHGRRQARRRPSRLRDSLPSFPFPLTQHTETREAGVGFQFFLAAVRVRWPRGRACVRERRAVCFPRARSRRPVVAPSGMVSALFGWVHGRSWRPLGAFVVVDVTWVPRRGACGLCRCVCGVPLLCRACVSLPPRGCVSTNGCV